MRFLTSSLLLLVVAGSSYTSSSNTSDAKINLFVPDHSLPLSPTLLSFSLEQDRWPDWTGITSENRYTYNALTNFAKNTGQPPKIRVGANSEDRARWSASVDIIESVFPPNTPITPYPEALNTTVGDGFYKLSKWLPKGTHMTWGLNMGYNDTENAVNMAESIFRAFNNGNQVDNTGVFLDILELGNEADLYRGKIRPSNWTVGEYVSNWENLMTPVVRALGLSPGGPIAVQGCAFAGKTFTPSGTFANGVLDSEPGKLITTISQHRYSGAFCTGGGFKLRSFMSKAAVRGNITVFSDDIAATRAKGLVYILGETNSIACHGAPNVSNTAGAALWTIDYTFQAATRGVSEVYFHEGIGFKYNFFQPITLDRSPIDDSPLSVPLLPHAQPDYYAGIIITEGVGALAAYGQTKIVEIDLNEDNISGYAIYENGLLARAVFINLNAWLLSDVGIRERGTTHIDFQFLVSDGVPATVSDVTQKINDIREVTIRRLAINHADDIQNLTWNGQSYETPDILVSGVPNEEKFELWEGFDIAETEAVMILFCK